MKISHFFIKIWHFELDFTLFYQKLWILEFFKGFLARKIVEILFYLCRFGLGRKGWSFLIGFIFNLKGYFLGILFIILVLDFVRMSWLYFVYFARLSGLKANLQRDI